MRVSGLLGLCLLAAAACMVTADLPPLSLVDAKAPMENSRRDETKEENDASKKNLPMSLTDPTELSSDSSENMSSDSPTYSTIFSKRTTKEPSKSTTKAPSKTTTEVPPDIPDIPTVAPPRTRNITVDDLGTAEGIILKSFKNRDFYGFMGMPFAKPPVDELRFKYPEPFEGPWENDYFDATYLRSRCAQASMPFSGIISGEEDCLHLAVYTPLLPEDLKSENSTGLPVMMFIHGGAYMSGDAYLYVPTKLMDRNVVVVVIQYRLGLFGFLAGGVAEAPGNMGLMDQVEALRWIQKHIHNFGGDHKTVTVFGQSAGGASSSWMFVTPVTHATNPKNNGRQLLHRAIPESGSALEEWTIDKDPETSFTFAASVLGCNSTTDQKKILSCMRKKNYEDITRGSLTIYSGDRHIGGLGFKGLCPVIQSDMGPDIELVIPKDPREILDAGEFLNIPIMTGSVRDEGSLVMGLTYRDFMVYNNHDTNDHLFLRDQALPTFMKAFGIDDKTASVSRSMQMDYLPNAVMGDWDSMIGGMIDMGGVMFLKSGLWELARRASLASKDRHTYFYSWEFEADDSLFDWIFFADPDLPVPGGVAHTDELLYLFHLPAVHDERQQVMIDRMTKIWTNFATYGNPTPGVGEGCVQWEEGIENWLPYDPISQNFMLVKDNFTMATDFTTRWTYHSKNDTTHQEPSMPPMDMDDMVSRATYNDMKLAKENYQIATGVIGVVLCFCFLLFIIVFVRKRRKVNAVV